MHIIGKELYDCNRSNFNTLRLRQNGHHFPDDIFKCIIFSENVWILLKISLRFAPKGPINNIPALVQIMAWRWPGDKPLSKPMAVGLLTHMCITRPQWVKHRSEKNKNKYTMAIWPQHRTSHHKWDRVSVSIFRVKITVSEWDCDIYLTWWIKMHGPCRSIIPHQCQQTGYFRY